MQESSSAYEYKPQFVKLIPVIEHPTQGQREELVALADRAVQGETDAERQIFEVLASMYGLSEEESNVVLSWTAKCGCFRTQGLI